MLTKRHTPWMSDDTMVAIREKNNAKHRADKSRSAGDSLLYKRMKIHSSL